MPRPAVIVPGLPRAAQRFARVSATALLGLALAAGTASAAALSLPLPEPLPAVRVLTLLVGLHLIGLCFGLGGATMLDFWILRWMR